MSGKRTDYLTWDEYFMGVAMLSGMRSKDPNTQVGCCIVSQDNKILSMGYNGFPLGCSDDEFPWVRDGEEVIYDCDKYADTPSVIASKRMMDAAGVRYHQYHRTNRKIEIEL